MRRVRCLSLVAALALLVSGCGFFSNGPDKAVTAFLVAWSAGDVPAAAAATDDPEAAADLLTAARTALAPAGLTATLGQLREATDRATASVDVTWDLGQGRSW
ncbi:MAG: penicillin-binding protein, partial [Pseudonocardia sp.]|nr:penicillin-binding protein [Pseudonocardia sp.]